MCRRRPAAISDRSGRSRRCASLGEGVPGCGVRGQRINGDRLLEPVGSFELGRAEPSSGRFPEMARTAASSKPFGSSPSISIVTFTDTPGRGQDVGNDLPGRCRRRLGRGGSVLQCEAAVEPGRQGIGQTQNLSPWQAPFGRCAVPEAPPSPSATVTFGRFSVASWIASATSGRTRTLWPSATGLDTAVHDQAAVPSLALVPCLGVPKPIGLQVDCLRPTGTARSGTLMSRKPGQVGKLAKSSQTCLTVTWSPARAEPGLVRSGALWIRMW